MAGSLLGPWKRDRREQRDLQRPWPSLDPVLPRGALRHPARPIPEHAAAEEPGDAPPKKRQRKGPEAMPAEVQTVGVLKADGSLELPVVPGVSPEVVGQAAVDGGRCGVCAACRAPPRSGRASRACDSLKAARQWKEALGGVTYAAVREIASKIELPRADVIYKGRVGYGLRCGLCPTCTGQTTKACDIPAAIAAGTLPPRLAAAAATRGNRISLQDYIRQMPANARAELGSATTAPAGLNSDDEEDGLRWAAWAEFLTPPPAAGQQGRAQRLEQQQQQRVRGGAAEDAARGPGAAPEGATEWVCRAQVRSAERPTPQRLTRRRSLDAVEACGHVNSKGALSCAACGAPRWDGPLGQLRARVAAALQGGLMAGIAGLPAAEQDATLAAAVAARMAAEAGTATDALPDFQGSEGSGPAGALQAIHAEVQAVRRAMAAADAPAREAGRRSGSALAASVAARATQLAGAVMELEGAVCRLVEEQEGLAAVKCGRRDSQGEDDGPGSAATAGEPSTDPLRALRSLRALLAEYRSSLASRPGSAMESEDGGGADGGGADAAETLGYSAFCARVSSCLSGIRGVFFHGDEEGTAEGRHRATCELLFCCPPPLARGWTEAALAQLEAVLCDVQAMEVLVAASHAGGTPMVKRALHALLRLAERSGAAAAAEGGAFLGSGGSQLQASQQLLLMPTQQSQPDPGLPSPGGEAPAPAAAPPPPADAHVAQSLAVLDDLIGAYEARQPRGPTPSGDADTDRARARRLAHASAATASFLYGLTHAVLDAVALRQAESMMPHHLSSAKATILE